jgi:hypothetical protein
MKVKCLKESQKSDNKMQPGLLANTSYLTSVLREERKRNIVSNFVRKLRKKHVDELTYLQEMNLLESERQIFDAKGFSLN